MKLHKRERSTSTYLQRGSFTPNALETGIKDQTGIDLDDHLMSFNRLRRASQTGISQEVTQQTVLLFQYLGEKKHLPGVIIRRNCGFKNILRGLIKLLPLKRQM